jgi:autophagy-related protein 16
MTDLKERLLERNARETTPFLSVFEANSTLLNQVDALQARCELAERELSITRQQLQEAAASSSGSNSKISSAAATTALKNEARLRDKLEELQEEYNTKLKAEAEEKEAALKTAKELSDLKDVNMAQEATIANLREGNQRSERAVEHLTNELNEAKSRTDLAEKQYEGLKLTIRTLQEENDKLQKENRMMEERLVSDKGKTVDEMNALTGMVNALKAEVDMLRSYKVQEEQRRTWFGSPKKNKGDVKLDVDSPGKGGRKFGEFGVIVPTSIKQTVAAHAVEGTCLRYNEAGSLLVSASSDSTVKLWDVRTGLSRGTFRGTSGHPVLSCDIGQSVIAGGGSDKTCRIWNLQTQRMVHHLVGHQHKITCVRLLGHDKGIVTGSADRSLKMWDISLKTYKQTVTLRHGSTCNSVDVASDSFTAVSGHLDGGLRFWDLRTGERSGDISGALKNKHVHPFPTFPPISLSSIGLHDSAITSVQFYNDITVLTNGTDSCLKIVDMRMGVPLATMRAPNFRVSHVAKAVYSPDGQHVLAGSENGSLFCWKSDGTFVSELIGHKAAVYAVDWGRGTQQVASLDRGGTMILWA